MPRLFFQLFSVIFASSLLLHSVRPDTVVDTNQGAKTNSSGTVGSAVGKSPVIAGDSPVTYSAKGSAPGTTPQAGYGSALPPSMPSQPYPQAQPAQPAQPYQRQALPAPTPLPGTNYIPPMLPEYTDKYDFTDALSVCKYVQYWQDTFINEGRLDAGFDQRPIYVSEAVATAAYKLWYQGKKEPAIDGARKLYLESTPGCAEVLSNTVKSVNVRLGYLRRRDPLAASICLNTALLIFDEKCFKVKKDELLKNLREYEQSLTKPFTNIRYAPKKEVEAVCAELGLTSCCEPKSTGDPRSFTYNVERKGQTCDFYTFFCI